MNVKHRSDEELLNNDQGTYLQECLNRHLLEEDEVKNPEKLREKFRFLYPVDAKRIEKLERSTKDQPDIATHQFSESLIEGTYNC